MSFLFFRSRPLARRMLLAAFALGPVNLHAAPVVTLPELDVDAADTPPLLDRTENANAVSGRMLRQRALSSPDSADLLSRLPGVSLYGAGGISSLPVINGMADDRVATSVDGVRIPPACPNHMNPAMSYISPDMVTEATAVAGITPVSMGGDSIAGTISVERKDPRFARRGKILFTGWARGAYHSNGNGWEGGLSSTVAGDWWSLNYSASYAERGDYHAGGGGGRVLSSSYKTYSHSVTAGFHKDNHLLALTFAQTDTPYEGFPNQYMDMTNNRSSSVNGKYSGAFDWGTLDVRGYWQRVNHAMNMLDDKGGHTATTGMPMNDDSRSAGYNIKATIPLGARNTLRLGNSFDHQGLNDWWPPLAGSMMMGPDTYHNINGGVRDRLGDYAEWESRITPSFHTLLGFRNDLVMMNTGSVSPYAWANGMSGMSSMGGMSGMGGMAGMGGMGGMAATDSAAANAFNAQNHRHTDVNFDVTALAHWDATRNVSIEGGYARKTRSPNFFERYAWGQSQMASQMIGWFGDGNGYVGNNNLSPEVANTASLTADFHDDARKLWNVKIQPYYTYVHHYVNVTRLKVFSDGFDQLKFVNHNAQIYGINSSASYQAWSAPQWGTGVFSAKLDWVRGQDLQTHTGLYHQMPTNGFIALDETYGDFTGRAEIQLVKRKSSVDALRSEPRTPGYALLNLTAGYKWRMMRFELGLDNVLNQRAYQPLGGYALGNYKADGDLMPVAVMGRSVNASIMASF